MTTTIYKAFRNTVAQADKDDDVWYAGYLWMDLTARQHKEIDGILDSKKFLTKVTNQNCEWYQFPNGLLFRRA